MSVRRWSGREARALRNALRLSVRQFAQQLGVAQRTVSKWESLGAGTSPRPDSQAILDTALARADAQAKQRFELQLVDNSTLLKDYYQGGSREWDYETWADDLGRAAACLARQDFTLAGGLVDRWLGRFDPDRLDAHGRYLQARSLVVLGDVQRDQGDIRGPLSAQDTYRKALQLFRVVDVPRRAAQVELSLVVIAEMAGQLELAAKRYEALAEDGRLSPRDRARAQLWIGTALSKNGDNRYATQVIHRAIQRFDDLREPDDWSVAHQKLALAYRGAGDLNNALRHIEVALSYRSPASPMQEVRLDTAHAHVLLSDKETSHNGLALLSRAATTARDHGMSHQLASINSLRHTFETSH